MPKGSSMNMKTNSDGSMFSKVLGVFIPVAQAKLKLDGTSKGAIAVGSVGLVATIMGIVLTATGIGAIVGIPLLAIGAAGFVGGFGIAADRGAFKKGE